ncbi:Beta-galactosidase 15 [Camellia lanceoleosa]|uniref:Beta-galactosidase 15 n=1 Tax=Camellia lanceoleosa TaxID=1840588 RepID=A0ACC0HWF5_9ERIC|nr:Beta-galactosidase 15 [Camellia lanceoleosa]
MSASLGSASSDLVESVRSTIDVVQQVATLVSTFAEFANSVRLTIEVVPQVASLVSTFTEFANAVRLTIEVVQQVASLVSRFAQFAISVRLTIQVVQKVASLVSRFARAFSEAIADCLDLLDLSAADSVFMIENEYGNVISSYGYAGKAYWDWCANMAISQNIGVPWIMCQESDAPEPMINTCNGWYCDQFTPNRPNNPKMWTENWTRWFKNWGGLDPHRTAEDLAFSVARFFQTGGTFQNYYMLHWERICKAWAKVVKALVAKLLSKEDGCSLEACDYRGTYDNNKCVTIVANLHKDGTMFRSFIPNDINTLVLFEEFEATSEFEMLEK